MCALFCRGSWPTAGPLQAHLARSNICEHLSSQEEMPRQTCATHPCSNLDTQGNVRHRTCSIEVNFMIWFPALDISTENNSLMVPTARLINGTLAFAFCMITHNTTKFENYVYHPVSTLVFTCVYIPDWFHKNVKDPWLIGKNTFQSQNVIFQPFHPQLHPFLCHFPVDIPSSAFEKHGFLQQRSKAWFFRKLHRNGIW